MADKAEPGYRHAAAIEESPKKLAAIVSVVEAKTGAVLDFSSDPLLNWASNLAFGRSKGFKRKDVYLANFGPGFGDGTTIVRFRTNHSGARLRR